MSVFLLSAAGLLCSCSSSSSTASAPEQNSQPPKQYKMHGEVVSLDSQGNVAKIKHDKIEGWMDAMTMEYPVKDASAYKSLHPGDCIDATVYVQDLQFWIGEVQPAPPNSGGACAPAPAK